MSTALIRHTFCTHEPLQRRLLVCVKLAQWTDVRANLLMISTFQLRFVCALVDGLRQQPQYRHPSFNLFEGGPQYIFDSNGQKSVCPWILNHCTKHRGDKKN